MICYHNHFLPLKLSNITCIAEYGFWNSSNLSCNQQSETATFVHIHKNYMGMWAIMLGYKRILKLTREELIEDEKRYGDSDVELTLQMINKWEIF